MTPASSQQTSIRRLALRRLGAAFIDWLWILAYLALLAAISIPVYLAGVRFPDEVWAALIPVFTVVPVTLAAAWREMGPRRATPGKRRLNLEVASSNGAGTVSFGRALIRNVGKIGVPWQLGHMASLGMSQRFGIESPPPIPATLWLVTVLSYLLVILHVLMLFVGSGRPLYDRLAGTTVIPKD